MNESVFRRAYFFIAMGIIFLLGAEDFEEDSPLASTLALLIALGFSLAGCLYYAGAKGLPRRYGLLGVLHFFGFWILLCVPSRGDGPLGVAE